MRNIFQACAQAFAEGEPVALAMVIRASPSSRVGEKMLVHRDGSTEGRFRDDSLADHVCQAGLAALNGGVSARLAYVQGENGYVQAAPDDAGDVEIFIQVLQPRPTLLLIGAGHIGEALVRMSKLLGWQVVVVDDRADFITPDRLPDADEQGHGGAHGVGGGGKTEVFSGGERPVEGAEPAHRGGGGAVEIEQDRIGAGPVEQHALGPRYRSRRF